MLDARRYWRDPALRFVALFLLLLVLEALAYPALTRRWPQFVSALDRATARVVYETLYMVGAEVVRSGNRIGFGDFSVRIIEECSGVFEMLILAAAVLAYPARAAPKAIGLGLGLPLLYLFNLLRILTLLVVGRYGAGYFDFFHVFFWQATLILMILGVWLAWIHFVVRADPERAHP